MTEYEARRQQQQRENEKLICQALDQIVDILGHIQRAGQAQLKLLISITPVSDAKTEILKEFLQKETEVHLAKETSNDD